MTAPCHDCILVKTVKDQSAALISAWDQLAIVMTENRTLAALVAEMLPPLTVARPCNSDNNGVVELRTCVQAEPCCHDGGRCHSGEAF